MIKQPKIELLDRDFIDIVYTHLKTNQRVHVYHFFICLKNLKPNESFKTNLLINVQVSHLSTVNFEKACTNL